MKEKEKERGRGKKGVCEFCREYCTRDSIRHATLFFIITYGVFFPFLFL